MYYLPVLFILGIMAATAFLIGVGSLIAWATIQTFRDRHARRRWEASLGMDFEIRPGRPGDPKAVWDRDLDH
jgi:hypothetical protein